MNTLRVASIALCALLACAPAAAQAPSGDLPTMKVGDSWKWVRSDRRTGIKEAEVLRTVTAVTAERIEGTENEGRFVLTRELHQIESAEWVRKGDPRFVDWPMAVGKKWSFNYVQEGKAPRYSARWTYDAEVVGQEKVKVPAGEFDTFKIVYKGSWNNDTGRTNGSASVTSWYAPAARASVKTEVQAGNTYNQTELVELKLQP
jgi:hypothetical protein